MDSKVESFTYQKMKYETITKSCGCVEYRSISPSTGEIHSSILACAFHAQQCKHEFTSVVFDELEGSWDECDKCGKRRYHGTDSGDSTSEK